MGWSPRCYMPSFMEISLLVPEKKIFKGFLPYMGKAAILVMWPRCSEQNIVPPTQGPRRLHIKFGIDQPSGFGEDFWALWTTDGRRLNGYTISSPCEPNGSGELINLLKTLSEKKCIQIHFCHHKTSDPASERSNQYWIWRPRISKSDSDA